MPLNVGRQAGVGDCDVVLNFNGVHVAIRADLEDDLQAISSRVVRVGAHVVHTVSAVYLLFDDLRDSFIDDAGISPRVSRAD